MTNLGDARKRKIPARVPPHNLEAEESLLGAMMLTNDAVRVAVAEVVPTDFYSPAHGVIFDTMKELWQTGRPTDPVVVADALDRAGALARVGGRQRLVELQIGTPASAHAEHYAAIVTDLAARRSFIEACADGQTDGFDTDDDIDDVVDRHRAALSAVKRAAGPRRFPHYAEWRQSIDMTEAFLVDGFIERRDRLILVAAEGLGKSHVLRQWALMCAAGVHWFTEQRMRPVPALVVDVENSERQLVRNTEAMYRFAEEKSPGFDPENFTVIPFTTLDLTSRADRLTIESYLAGHRPALLVLGPLYKILPPPSWKVSYEESALQGIHVIDDWRARFDVAVLIEHHAAKGSQGRRDFDPLGSSAWLRWPEYGIKLEPDNENPRMTNLGHFRGQRTRRAWPKQLERGGPGQWNWRAPFDERTGSEPF